jgi:hypothetical protein
MLSRRIREHLVELNWLAVLIDLAIVVLGVFLGMQVNNWNQRRVEAEQGRSYRERLIRELDFNARQYEQQQHYYRQVFDHGVAAIAALDGRTKPSPNDFLVDAYQLSQVDTTPPKTYIYDEMVSSGLVTRLGSEAVQEMASDYYLNIRSADRVIGDTQPYRTTIRGAMPFAMQSAIRERCGDRLVVYKQRIIGVTLADHCDVQLAPAETASAVQRIRSTPGLLREMTRYVASVDEKLDLLDTNRAMTTRFIHELQQVR